MKNKLPKRKESEIQKSIMMYLKAKGYYAIRMNTGSFKTESGGYFKQGTKGMADILCLKCKDFYDGDIKSNGKDILFALHTVYWIEVKREGNTQSEAQKYFQEDVEHRGHKYILAYGIEDLEKEGL